MGLIDAPSHCFITDSPTNNISNAVHCIDYFTEYAGKNLYLRFGPRHVNSEFVEKNKFILKGLIINNKFPYNKDEPNYDNEKLERIINEANIPKTPKEKVDNLVLFLSSIQDYSGQSIDIESKIELYILVSKLYFKNFEEYWFYFNTIKEMGLIDFNDASTKDFKKAERIRFTYKGLEYVVNLEESGDLSKKCFIAMSFSEAQLPIREVIKGCIISCGYQPLLVDEVPIPSEVTINDAIISLIKQCKFMISDFSEQKNGVYFEVGFALGLKKPVIYLCNKNDFKDTHFDTNHYPFLRYETFEELSEMLINRIKAWID